MAPPKSGLPYDPYPHYDRTIFASAGLPYGLGRPWDQLPPRPPRGEDPPVRFKNFNTPPHVHDFLIFTSYEFRLIFALLGYVNVTQSGRPYLEITPNKTLRCFTASTAYTHPRGLDHRVVSQIAYLRTYGRSGASRIADIFNPRYGVFENPVEKIHPLYRDEIPPAHGMIREMRAQGQQAYWMDEMRDAWKEWYNSGGRMPHQETPKELWIAAPPPMERFMDGRNVKRCHRDAEPHRNHGMPNYTSNLSGRNAEYTLMGPLMDDGSGGYGSIEHRTGHHGSGHHGSGPHEGGHHGSGHHGSGHHGSGRRGSELLGLGNYEDRRRSERRPSEGARGNRGYGDERRPSGGPRGNRGYRDERRGGYRDDDFMSDDYDSDDYGHGGHRSKRHHSRGRGH
ncbi:uncharacterized protein KY384_007505 [Bacidia gigantensis]|uniref:uncharacterized protein n=1 Tax=Bacidia gigantensis TaxID=2732470 RepID=UPI001D043E6C|nr:uncharacterized protein KY384_007505 [Bacidia gigantensis]KAG8527353.1 hypothetical protein KY384_007505 [Bacidia gigantensis]